VSVVLAAPRVSGAAKDVVDGLSFGV